MNFDYKQMILRVYIFIFDQFSIVVYKSNPFYRFADGGSCCNRLSLNIKNWLLLEHIANTLKDFELLFLGNPATNVLSDQNKWLPHLGRIICISINSVNIDRLTYLNLYSDCIKTNQRIHRTSSSLQSLHEISDTSVCVMSSAVMMQNPPCACIKTVFALRSRF